MLHVCEKLHVLCNFEHLISDYAKLRDENTLLYIIYNVCLGFEDFKTLKDFISCSCLQFIISTETLNAMLF